MDGPRGSACAIGVDRCRLSRCVFGPAFWYGMDSWRMGRRGPGSAAKSMACAGSRCPLLSGLAGKLWFEPYPMGLARICDPRRANGADCPRKESHDLNRPQRADRCVCECRPLPVLKRLPRVASRDPGKPCVVPWLTADAPCHHTPRVRNCRIERHDLDIDAQPNRFIRRIVAHSCRRAFNGSTLVARCAGINVAARATMSKTAGTKI